MNEQDSAFDGHGESGRGGTPRRHVPVLLEETLRFLAPKTDEVFVDCTAGLGGHAEAVGAVVGPGGTVVLNDLDRSNLMESGARLRGGGGPQGPPRVITFHGNFAEVPGRLAEAGFEADMMLADLGFASVQVEDPARGFSFSREGPLDMRLDPSRGISAADLVGSLPEVELARILREFGEERAANQIARKLVQERAVGPINTTSRLADIVRSVVRGKPGSGRPGGGIDPATKTFQALRIAVNDEIGSLEALLGAIRIEARRLRNGRGSGRGFLKAGARVAIIAFHSLEDRPVKRAFAELVKDGFAEDVSDGAVKAGEAELQSNPRSRSATLRVIRMAQDD